MSFLTQEAWPGKKRTPALTVPQARVLTAAVLNQALGSQRPARLRRTMNRRLERDEAARLYHWRRRNRLPPRRFDQRS
jgi:hypothetical protein